MCPSRRPWTRPLRADRNRLLRERWKQVQQAAILKDESGFAWGTRQNIGPVIAPNAQQALQLISVLAVRPEAILDVPARQAGFIRLLTQTSWRSLGVRPLMLLNATTLPGRRDLVFGPASLAYG